MNLPQTPQQDLVLEYMKYGQAVRTRHPGFHHWKAHKWLYDYGNELALSIEAHVLSRKLESRTVTLRVLVPDTWLDLVVSRLGWDWLRRCHPVKCREFSQSYTFEVRDDYPDAVVTERLGAPIRYSTKPFETITRMVSYALPKDDEDDDCRGG